jgi:hypothetical protein
MRAGLAVVGILLGMVVSRAQTVASFENVAKAVGLTFTHINGASPEKYLVETMGSGAAFLDYDNDGWIDLSSLTAVDRPAEARGEGGRETPTLSQRRKRELHRCDRRLRHRPSRVRDGRVRRRRRW